MINESLRINFKLEGCIQFRFKKRTKEDNFITPRTNDHQLPMLSTHGEQLVTSHIEF